jgi:hypothetical protein
MPNEPCRIRFQRVHEIHFYGCLSSDRSLRCHNPCYTATRSEGSLLNRRQSDALVMWKQISRKRLVLG